MTAIKRLLQESGVLTLAEGATKGSYRVRIITEGKGSSGFYPGTLIDASESVFDPANSFVGHPENIYSPQNRNPATIAGQVANTTVEDDTLEDGTKVRAIFGDYTPNSQWAQFVKENAGQLALSIYCPAIGHEDELGNFVVDAFESENPYKSVDIVVAAGRGGKFLQTAEALLAIESSLGIKPSGTQTPATSVEDHQNTKEGHMTPEQIAELKTLIATEFKTFATEFKAALEADQVAAQAIADAATDTVAEAAKAAVKTYEEKATAIDAAEGLVESQRAALKIKATEGADIVADLAAAVAIAAEFKAAAPDADTVVTAGRTLSEGAAPKGDAASVAGKAW